MGLFLANTGLDCLREGDHLQERLVGTLLAKSKVESVGEDGSSYRTCSFPSGLSLVFRMAGESVVDGDMYYGGHCIWQVKPVATIPHGGFLSLDLIMMDKDGRNSYAASLIKPAVVPQFSNIEQLDVQVSGFPLAVDVFDNRQSYETVSDKDILLSDGQVIPYNYLMTRQEGLSKKEMDFFTRKIQFNLVAGEVVALEEKENGWHDSSFLVATVRTVMGNLDLILSGKQTSNPLHVGCYLLCEALISTQVVAIDGKRV